MKSYPTTPWSESQKSTLAVLEELKELEPLFHHPELGTDRETYENMIVDDFWEVGASGKKYAAEFVLGVIEKRNRNQEPDHWKTSDFHCRQLAENVFLVTYTLHQGEKFDRLTHRCTLWKKEQKRWIALYHQGTLITL